MFCRKCGSEIRDGAKFCNKCGNEVKTVSKIAQMQNNSAFDDTESQALKSTSLIGQYEDVSSSDSRLNSTSEISASENRQYDIFLSADKERTAISGGEASKEKSASGAKKLWAVLIPVISLIVAAAILIPTVILPMLDKSKTDDSENGETTSTTTTTTATTTTTVSSAETTSSNDIEPLADEDLENLAHILVNSRSVTFNSNALTSAFVVDEILTTQIAVAGYISYFEDGTWEVTSSAKDPLKKFSQGYIKLNADNVKWICENIYRVQFDESYTSENSYCYNGYVYRKVVKGGDFSPVVKITGYKKFKDNSNDAQSKYEVKYELSEKENLLGKYKAVVDLKLIDGERHWTFYSVEAVS